MVNIAPCRVLATRRIVKFVAKKSVLPVEQKMEKRAGRGKNPDPAAQRHAFICGRQLRRPPGDDQRRQHATGDQPHLAGGVLSTLIVTCGNNEVELRPAFFHIGSTLRFDFVLRRPAVVAVTFVEHFHHVHAIAFDNRERRKAHSIQAKVVLQIDEDLRRARIRPGRCKTQRSALVRLGNGIIREFRMFPRGGNSRPVADSELHDESRHDSKERGVVVEMCFHQIIEAVRGKR